MMLTPIDIMNPLGKYIMPLEYLMGDNVDSSRRNMIKKFGHKVIDELVINACMKYVDKDTLALTKYSKGLIFKK
jgi:hypothetical protein